jgi:DNA-binding MarR family transcriptional regulator
MNAETSKQAYEFIQPELGERQYQVLKAIRQIQPCTNTEISRYLQIPINQITGRCVELRNKKLVTYSHSDKCPVTNRQANFWKTTKFGNGGK